MHICGLRLTGFTSFAGPVDLPVGQGLTALIGGNCSGKSNVLAAVRWVLGFTNRQPAETIFASSEKQCEQAEVAISFADCRGRLPGPQAAQSQVTLSRTLTRDGEDSFHINGFEVGLRDVKVMLGDAGVDIPPLVSRRDLLGLIDSTPRDRYAVIQSAAGVSGLLTRHGAISEKLAETRQTMKVLDTRVAELSQRFETTKSRQAEGRERRSRREKASRLLVRILRTRWIQADGETALARRILRDVADRCDAHEAARKQASARIAEATDFALAAGTDSLAALDKLSQARLRQAHNEGRHAAAQSLLDQLEAEEPRLQESMVREDDLLTEARLLRDHADAGLSALAEEGHVGIDPSSGSLQGATEPNGASRADRDVTAEWNAACEALRSAGNRLRKVESALMTSIAGQKQSAMETQKLKRARQQIVALDERISALTEITGDTGDDTVHAARSDARHALNHAHVACEQCRQTCVEADKALAEARADRRVLDDPLVVQERLVGSLTAQIEILEQLSEEEGSTEPTDVSWLAPRRRGLEKALLAALGDDFRAPSDDTVHLVHWAGSGGAIGLYLPDEAEPLDKLVENPDHLSKRLAQCGLVKKEDGPRLQTQLHQGQKLVSPEGDMWRWDGFVKLAETAGANDVSTPDVNERLQSARDAMTDAYSELKRIRSDIRDRADVLTEAEREAEAGARALSKAIENVAWQREIVLRAEGASGQARQKREADQARLTELEAEKKEILAELGYSTAEPEDTDCDTGAGPAQELAAAHAEQTIARRRLDSLDGQRKDAVRRRTELAEERQSWKERADLAARRLDTLREHRKKLAGRIAATRSDLTALDNAAAGLAERTASAETAEKEARSDAARLREKQQRCASAMAQLGAESPPALKEAEERLESALRREDEIGREIRSRLCCDPSVLMASTLGTDTEPVCIETAEAELASLKEANAGDPEDEQEDDGTAMATDIGAQEELIAEAARERGKTEAAAARFDASLVQLGETATELQTRTFELVDSHFRVLFPAIMGRGEGHLELIPARSPQDIGLEIHILPTDSARPRSLAMMSENEKILTALALVLSIFTVRPALLGVFDDLDSGLDRSHADRLCVVLRHIADHTGSRFVLTSGNSAIANQCDTVLTASMDDGGANSITRSKARESANVAAA